MKNSFYHFENQIIIFTLNLKLFYINNKFFKKKFRFFLYFILKLIIEAKFIINNIYIIITL